jgi:hypothetical protein
MSQTEVDEWIHYFEQNCASPEFAREALSCSHHPESTTSVSRLWFSRLTTAKLCHGSSRSVSWARA